MFVLSNLNSHSVPFQVRSGQSASSAGSVAVSALCPGPLRNSHVTAGWGESLELLASHDRQHSQYGDRDQDAREKAAGISRDVRMLCRWTAEAMNGVKPGAGHDGATVYAAAVHSNVKSEVQANAGHDADGAAETKAHGGASLARKGPPILVEARQPVWPCRDPGIQACRCGLERPTLGLYQSVGR